MALRDSGFSTKAVHGGERLEKGSVAAPIYETSVFAFASTKELIDVISERGGRLPLHEIRQSNRWSC